MANNLTSNVTLKVARAFIKAFESQRVLTKTVDTQLFSGEFNPSSGSYVRIKRPHRYNPIRTAAGDISSSTWNDIISGSARATVQNYITVAIPWTNYEEALELDQLETILKPAAETATIELESSFCDFMIQNAGLVSGTPGTAIDAWSDIAAQGSLMKSIGVPAGEMYSVVNPFIIQSLASAQTGLSADPSRLVQTAWEQAQVASPSFAGMRLLSSNALNTFTSMTGADRAGTLSANADCTYVTAKDTMQQTLAVTGLEASATVKAGDMVEVEGRYLINQRNGNLILDAAGAPITFKATVTADVALDGSGAGNLVVSGAGIYEATGQYNNINSALTSGDVVNVLGTTGATYQPCLFYLKEAFSIAFVKLPKLFSTDTVASTSDGISLRISKYSDGDANSQKMRIDLLPAFGCMDPFMSGKGFGY